MRPAGRVGVALVAALAGCDPSDPVELPAPTGPHGVGRTTLRWQDPARSEPMTDAPEDHRQLTAHLWYPAEAAGAASPAPYLPDAAALEPVLDDGAVAVFRRVRAHARADAPPAGAPARFPVLLLSPGNDMLSAHYTFLAEELASQGYVVVGLDHPGDVRAVLLADGGKATFAGSRWPAPPPPDPSGRPIEDSPHALFYRERAGVRADDARLALRRLTDEALAAGGPDLRQRLDLERIGFLGHSVGGVAAGEACRREPALQACVNLDGESPLGPFFLDPAGPTFAQPYLMLTKPIRIPDEQLARWGLDRPTWEAQIRERHRRFFGSLPGGSHRVVLDGASHGSFSDEPFVFAALEEDAAHSDHQARMDAIRDLLLAFFDHHLRGEPADTLRNVFAQPGVAAETWLPH